MEPATHPTMQQEEIDDWLYLFSKRDAPTRQLLIWAHGTSQTVTESEFTPQLPLAFVCEKGKFLDSPDLSELLDARQSKYAELVGSGQNSANHRLSRKPGDTDATTQE